MKLELVRFLLNPGCTIGDLLVNGEHDCWAIEDVVRAPGVKVFGKTAIPYGTYPVTVTFSNRFQRDLPLLGGVPNFEGIRIHPGNTAADTEGCILPGTKYTSTSVTSSRLAFGTLFTKIRDAIRRGEAVTITIKQGDAP